MPRRATRILLLVVILTAAVPGISRAEWQLSPFFGQTFAGKTTAIDLEGAVDRAHRHYGGSVVLVGDGVLGVEGLFLVTPAFLQRPSSVPEVTPVASSYQLALMGNVVLTTPRRWNEYGLRPYVSGGLGLLRIVSDDAFALLPVRLNARGYNAGGGAVGFLSNTVGLRFDLRYFRMAETELPGLTVGELGANLSFWTFSVGVTIRP